MTHPESLGGFAGLKSTDSCVRARRPVFRGRFSRAWLRCGAPIISQSYEAQDNEIVAVVAGPVLVRAGGMWWFQEFDDAYQFFGGIAVADNGLGSDQHDSAV